MDEKIIYSKNSISSKYLARITGRCNRESIDKSPQKG